MEVLQSDHIYLDAQVFESMNFQYEHGRLKEICDYANKNTIFLYLTDITLREIKARISKKCKESIQNINELKNKARILRNLPEFQFVFSFNENTAHTSLLQQFEDFIIKGKVTVLSVKNKNISAEDVFNRYFEALPPFSDGKKKYEFPDAFTIAVLENWCKFTNNKIYVVSGDNDILSACFQHETLLYISSLPEMLENIQYTESKKQEIREKLLTIAYQFIAESQDQVKENIRQQFEKSEFILESDLSIPVEDCEVISVSVDSINYETENLVSLHEEDAVFQIRIKMQYSANVSYPDPDMTAYDKEDGIYLVFETLEGELKREQEMEIEVGIYFEKYGNTYRAEINFVNLLDNGPFEVQLEEDRWPYK